jgi:hypothetical protein
MLRFRSRLRSDTDISRFFSVDVGKILIRLELRAGGGWVRAQNIDSQELASKIFRAKELRVRIAPGLRKWEWSRIRAPFHFELSVFSVKVVRHKIRVSFG